MLKADRVFYELELLHWCHHAVHGNTAILMLVRPKGTRVSVFFAPHASALPSPCSSAPVPTALPPGAQVTGDGGRLSVIFEPCQKVQLGRRLACTYTENG